MEARRDGEVSNGGSLSGGKSREGGARRTKGGAQRQGRRDESGYGRERACEMNSLRAGVFSTQGRSAPGIGVGKSFDVSYIADLV